MHRHPGWSGGAIVFTAGEQGCGTRHPYPGRAGNPRKSESPAGRLYRRTSGAVRLLHEWHDHDRPGAAQSDSKAHCRPSQNRSRGVPLPLWHAHEDRTRGAPRVARIGGNAMNTNLSRRDILRGGSALLISFAWNPIGRAAGEPSETVAARFAGKPVDGTEVDSFLAIQPDGSATVFTGKVDLGTGLRIAIRQMAADALGLAVARVDLVEGETLLTPDQGRTGGRSGLTQGGVGVRQAAPPPREHLISLAADRPNRAPAPLVLPPGPVPPTTPAA